jgi:hypothetical protein
MLNFRPGAGAVVAADSKNAVAAVDDALLNSVRMCASIIEATQGSDLPPTQSQKLLTTMTAGLQSVVTGRGEIVSTIRHLAFIKSRSNFAPLDFGCPVPWEPLASADDAEAPSADLSAQPAAA